MRQLLNCLLCLLATPASLQAAPRTHVLVISIDGMRPDYVSAADEHHLKIPVLREFMKQGGYAEGVRGVIPTFTYPSHTTLMTGVWPEVHGVYNNAKFDPLGELDGAVITDAAAIKVQTLWQAAKAAGYSTASVGWPVTTGATGIDHLLPANAALEGGAGDGEAVADIPAGTHYDFPAGLRETLSADLPPGTLSVDDKRFAWTMAILRHYKPEFMTTHLIDLDHAEHATGPFSAQSNAALEEIDSRVGRMIELERSIDPRAYIVIVSDHGFVPVEQKVNLGVLLVQAGLIERRPGAKGAKHDVRSWEAQLWNSGGTAAVVLHDANDTATREKVKAVLDAATQRPELGINRILTHDEVTALAGGYPDAAFVVEFKPGFAAGGARTGPLVTPAPGTGTHGFLPDRPELYASFLIEGPGVAAGRDFHVVGMRQVAPTLAQLLHIQFPQAKEKPIHWQK